MIKCVFILRVLLLNKNYYGLDATYTTTTMANPFFEGNAKITFLNSYQEIFYPAFVTMFMALDKSNCEDDREPVNKKSNY